IDSLLTRRPTLAFPRLCHGPRGDLLQVQCCAQVAGFRALRHGCAPDAQEKRAANDARWRGDAADTWIRTDDLLVALDARSCSLTHTLLHIVEFRNVLYVTHARRGEEQSSHGTRAVHTCPADPRAAPRRGPSALSAAGVSGHQR